MNDNLKPIRSVEEAREKGHAGGIASGKARRERKTLAETLRAEMEKDAGSGLTRQEYIVAKCLSDLAKGGKVTPKDLKTLAEVLGELKQNITVTQTDFPEGMTKQEAVDYLARMNK